MNDTVVRIADEPVKTRKVSLPSQRLPAGPDYWPDPPEPFPARSPLTDPAAQLEEPADS
jgi:hypothetical protein